MSPSWVNEKGEIEYDVSHVPWPSLKDPGLDGMREPARLSQPLKPLPPEFERYRLFNESNLGEWPPVDWLIRGYLAIGELTVLYGKPDTYKSFVALDWACYLAHTGILVVYIVAEGASGIKARIAAWKKRHGVSDLLNLMLMPSTVSLQKPESVETFIGAMREQLDNRDPGLVVVDTLARNFVGGNENSSQDMGMFVEGLERIRREFLTAVLVLHHSTKDGKSERGTESLRAASFAMFELERVNQHQVKMKCDRMKDAEPPGEVAIRPNRVDLPELGEGISSLVADWPYGGANTRRDSRLRSEVARREFGANLSRPERAMLGAIAGANEGANLAQLTKVLRISSRTASRRANSLVNLGFLAAEGSTRDRRFTITAAGRGVAE